MNSKKKKTLILNTLLLFFCVGVIALFCMMPSRKVEVLEKYMVNFDPNDGGAIAAIEIEDGKEVEEPEEPTREGYIFVGWMLGDELYDFSQGVSGDITLKAAWKEIEPDKTYYTVSFNTDGGTTVANQVIESGQTAIQPDDPVKDGYTFEGWQVNGVLYDFAQPVTSNITLSAIWFEVETPEEPEQPSENKTYTVRFDGNGGTLGKNCSNQNVQSGERAKAGCTATRSGYTLVGFNSSKSATSANLSTKKITADTTFYAIWKKNATTTPTTPVTKYKISFNLQGASGSCSAVELAEGTKITDSHLSCKPTKPYYTFARWVDSNGYNPVGSLLRSNITLYPSWTKKTFTVSCDGRLGGPAGQECALVVSGVSDSAISSITYTVSGKQATASPYNGGFKMNYSAFSRVTGFTITINNETFTGKKA